jgi:hypothetical protein
VALPIYPVKPDDSALRAYLAEQPGARFIGDQWRAWADSARSLDHFAEYVDAAITIVKSG